MRGKSGESLFAQLIYHEAGAIANADLTNFTGYAEDLIGIGSAVLNQWDVDNFRLSVYANENGQEPVCPLGQCLRRELFEILTATALASDKRGRLFDSSGNMREPDRSQIDAVLDGDLLAGVPLLDNGNLIGSHCEGIVSSVVVASRLLDGSVDRLKPNGMTILFWNKAAVDDTKRFPGSRGYDGYRSGRVGGHTFWGLSSVPPIRRPIPPKRGRVPVGGPPAVE